jgi:hypothetical protein
VKNYKHREKLLLSCFLIMLGILSPAYSYATDLTAIPRVVDGDTIHLNKRGT